MKISSFKIMQYQQMQEYFPEHFHTTNLLADALLLFQPTYDSTDDLISCTKLNVVITL